ncbi:cation-translocating P-type ATPase, partial [Eisenbergiella porci]|uniref:cation-translocating P-type ATPase n=1 Tax=Eisenbergiella porci TaxID=2652274 RepID=UPI002A80B2DA
MAQYSKPLDEVISELHSSRSEGLSGAQAEERLAQYGPNRLRAKKKKSNLQRFLEQFKDVMILILIAAAVVSFIVACNGHDTSEFFEPLLILVIVILNAVMGMVQESKAEKAMEALQSMSAPHARVIRDGKELLIDADKVVPGDIILVEAGDNIPADARLIESASLKSEESALTGESVPSEKDASLQIEEKAPLGDRANMIYSGCSVAYGRGRAIVTATGMQTEMGHIAGLLEGESDTQTPLQQKLAQLGKYLGFLAIAVCAVIFVIGLIDGMAVMEIFMTAVSLAVSAIPEGLPAIVTIVLSIGVQRMVKQNAIIRRLPAVETLGSASVICSDKTGTLTRNEMTVERVVTPSGEVQITGTGYAPEGRMVMTGGVSPESEQAQIVADEVVATLVAGTLANDGELREENGRWEIVGDPTEVSLIVAARKVKADRKIKRYTRVGEIPFTSERKRMSIIAKDSTDSDKLTVFAKGAPDVLLSYCTRIR